MLSTQILKLHDLQVMARVYHTLEVAKKGLSVDVIRLRKVHSGKIDILQSKPTFGFQLDQNRVKITIEINTIGTDVEEFDVMGK